VLQKGGMPQLASHPVMQVPPGYGAYPVGPQGRQFSSPNSAFSPVTTYTGTAICLIVTFL